MSAREHHDAIRCETTIRSPLAPTWAFDYLADLRNFEQWHPSILRAELVEGDPELRNSRFRMITRFAGAKLPTEIELLERARPHRIAYSARTSLTLSDHQVILLPCGDGVEVISRSDWRLLGPGRALQGLAPRLLTRFCDRAALGLRAALGEHAHQGPTWIPGAGVSATGQRG